MESEESILHPAYKSIKNAENIRTNNYDTPEINGFSHSISGNPQNSISYTSNPLSHTPSPPEEKPLKIQQRDLARNKNKGEESRGSEGRRSKNSNVIKKYGRIINNHLKRYLGKEGKGNEGIRKMLDRLRSEMGNKKKKTDMMDLFNTYHLNVLLNECEEKAGSENLKMLHKMLKNHLRKDVFNSHQLSLENKLMYTNTLKMMQLRTCNKKLALRLKTESLSGPEVREEEAKMKEEEKKEEVVEEREERVQQGGIEEEEYFYFPSQDNSLIDFVDQI